MQLSWGRSSQLNVRKSQVIPHKSGITMAVGTLSTSDSCLFLVSALECERELQGGESVPDPSGTLNMHGPTPCRGGTTLGLAAALEVGGVELELVQAACAVVRAVTISPPRDQDVPQWAQRPVHTRGPRFSADLAQFRKTDPTAQIWNTTQRATGMRSAGRGHRAGAARATSPSER